MGLSYVGYYAMSSEAWVVRSVLRSAGIPAEVFDHSRGSMIWTEQTMLGGFRVAVPTRDLDDSLAILKEVAPRAERIKDAGWTVGAMIVALFCFSFDIALWGYPRTKTRPTPWRVTAFIVLLVIEGLGWAGLFLTAHRQRF
jgi:hypothetical protein